MKDIYIELPPLFDSRGKANALDDYFYEALTSMKLSDSELSKIIQDIDYCNTEKAYYLMLQADQLSSFRRLIKSYTFNNFTIERGQGDDSEVEEIDPTSIIHEAIENIPIRSEDETTPLKLYF